MPRPPKNAAKAKLQRKNAKNTLLLLNMTQTAVQHIILLKMKSPQMNASQQQKGYMLKSFPGTWRQSRSAIRVNTG